MKLLSVIGTRPQYVKASAIFHELKRYPQIKSVLVDSGQHYDDNLSEIFLRELEIPTPDYNLGVGSGSHADQTAGIISKLDPILEKEKPDWVLVYGDTNTTLGGALTAAKRNIPVVHVEAGVRLGNRAMPEEINRIVADHLSTLLCVVTESGMDLLAKEGITAPNAVYCGDVMYDVCLRFKELSAQRSDILKKLKLTEKQFIAATIHRAENADDAKHLAAIVDAFTTLSKEYRIVLPLHPRTRKALEQAGLMGKLEAAVTITEPLGYLDMARLTSTAALVATDSGGLQREAFFYHVPCVNIHTDVFWPELEAMGWNHVVRKVDAPTIIATVQNGLKKGTPKTWSNPFGSENNAKAIIEALLTYGNIRRTA